MKICSFRPVCFVTGKKCRLSSGKVAPLSDCFLSSFAFLKNACDICGAANELVKVREALVVFGRATVAPGDGVTKVVDESLDRDVGGDQSFWPRQFIDHRIGQRLSNQTWSTTHETFRFGKFMQPGEGHFPRFA